MATIDLDDFDLDAFNAAERQKSIDALLARVAADHGAAFAPASLNFLKGLRAKYPGQYETVIKQLKLAGVRVSKLEELLTAAHSNASNRLLEVALASASLFHTPDGTRYADLDINGHRETWPVNAKSFRRWLARLFHRETGNVPSQEVLQSVANVLDSMAEFDGPEIEVYLRVASVGDKTYLDLCDPDWRAIEIDRDGWREIATPPVRFRRTKGMLALPVPVKGSSVKALRKVLNITSDDDFVITVMFLVTALRGAGPFPVLVIVGESGAAKTSGVEIIVGVYDPHKPKTRGLPKDARDLAIYAHNAYGIAFDNLSGLSASCSDDLCRLATGSGFGTRQLHSDLDETLVMAKRPIVTNGISDVATRSDLADRALSLKLDFISENKRRTKDDIEAAFNVALPGILGALLDIVAHGLKQLPKTKLKKLPRMADFALWAAACETALWKRGTFAKAYRANRITTVEAAIEDDLVSSALREFMDNRVSFSGNADGLLTELNTVVTHKDKTWPDTARGLSGKLRRAQTNLRKVGIKIEFSRDRDSKRERRIEVSWEKSSDSEAGVAS